MSFEEIRSGGGSSVIMCGQTCVGVVIDPELSPISCCEFGKPSTLAANTLHTMGYVRAVALDGGMKGRREADIRSRPRRRTGSRPTSPSC